jgi:hypothetical protein
MAVLGSAYNQYWLDCLREAQPIQSEAAGFILRAKLTARRGLTDAMASRYFQLRANEDDPGYITVKPGMSSEEIQRAEPAPSLFFQDLSEDDALKRIHGGPPAFHINTTTDEVRSEWPGDNAGRVQRDHLSDEAEVSDGNL